MKVIALMGSPRIGSNTDILVDRAIEGLKSSGNSVEVKKVNLVDYKDEVCTACGKCRASGNCEPYEKTNKLLQEIKSCDTLILGTPTWWGAMSSYMKIFTDHWGAFLLPDYSSRLAGKSAIILSCCANPDVNIAEQVCEQIKGMLGFLKVNIKGTLGVKGLLGEKSAVMKNKEALDKAYALGKALV